MACDDGLQFLKIEKSRVGVGKAALHNWQEIIPRMALTVLSNLATIVYK
jgi:hypothetical protein